MFPDFTSNTVHGMSLPDLPADDHEWSILICLLGHFRLLNGQHSMLACGGERAEAFLGYLAIHSDNTVPREQLLALLWPESNPLLASQSLNSLVYAVRKELRNELGGAAPILQVNGAYRLNEEAGVGVDVALFERYAHAGERHARAGAQSAASVFYRRAIELYQGDLCLVPDPQAMVEREQLRARYLTVLMWLADHDYGEERFRACLGHVQRLLLFDPCREDAHRLAMRCYVHLGERAQAFRQYRLCTQLLMSEFGAVPEPATTTLYDQIRLDPASV